MNKRIFVGGMGRSGTTITLATLSFHPALYAIPIETKFLVEADGFYELARALHAEYSTAATPIAIERFAHLMRRKVTGLEPSSFTEQAKLSSDIFDDYHGAVDEFLELVLYRQYQTNRDAVLNGVRRFLARTFDRIAQISNKQGWAEKTPANFWRIEFLRELYPDSDFIHCIRDPRFILASLIRKGWLPAEPVKAAMQFESMLAALATRRRTLLTYPRFFELRLEQLESEQEIGGCLQQLSEQLQLEPFSNWAIESTLEKIAKYYRAKEDEMRFTPDQALLINQLLLPWVVELGYPATFPAELLKTPTEAGPAS